MNVTGHSASVTFDTHKSVRYSNKYVFRSLTKVDIIIRTGTGTEPFLSYKTKI